MAEGVDCDGVATDGDKLSQVGFNCVFFCLVVLTSVPSTIVEIF